MATCETCRDDYSDKRAALGYRLCPACGEKAARGERASWCVVPIAHKQGATLVTDKTYLRGLNKVTPT